MSSGTPYPYPADILHDPLALAQPDLGPACSAEQSRQGVLYT
jgi:hypothetical protein